MALLFLLFALCLSPFTNGRVLEKDGNTGIESTVLNLQNVGGLEYNEKLCEACELVSAQLSSFLSDSNSTESIVDAVVSSLCSKFTGTAKEQCTIVVEDYVPEIISSLETSLETGDLCTGEKICDSKNVQKKKSAMVHSKCALCEVAALELKTLIQNNETQAQVLSMLYSVCSRIKGGSVNDACQNVVDAYYPDLLDIISSLSANEFCTYVGYCSMLHKLSGLFPSFATKKDSAMVSGLSLPTKQPGDCFACKMMVAYFRNKLKDEENQEKFKNTLLVSCEKVPNYVDECREAITEYLPAVYANVDTIFNGTAICEKVGACLPHFFKSSMVIRLPVL